MRINEDYKVNLAKIKLHKEMAIKIIKIGLPTGIQNMVISLSNVLIQSSINVFGSKTMAGFGAYLKIDGFNILPVMSLSKMCIRDRGIIHNPYVKYNKSELDF